MGVDLRSRIGPPPEDVDRIERAVGWRPTRFRQAAINRSTAKTAARWIVADDRDPEAGGRSAFVKIGTTELTAVWTRIENRNYRSLRGSFLPQLLGFDDDGQLPVLPLEDLSGADWPPPWTDQRVAAVLEALAAIHQTSPPDHLTPEQPDAGSDWRAIAADPKPFIALGLCSANWLKASLRSVIDASAQAPIAGESLVHLDIRSDNVAFGMSERSSSIGTTPRSPFPISISRSGFRALMQRVAHHPRPSCPMLPGSPPRLPATSARMPAAWHYRRHRTFDRCSSSKRGSRSHGPPE